METIFPKRLCPIDPKKAFFFLAGPVGGGDDWQSACCQELQKKLSDFQVAIPWAYKKYHPLISQQLPGCEDHFDRQLTWERHYLDCAAKSGCIIFWLPSESKTNPRQGKGPYAMDTRGELGEWRGRLMYDPSLRVVIGAEADFFGLSTLQRNFDLALGYSFPIYDTLAKTVNAAIEKVR